MFRSSAEAKYRVMIHTPHELLWLNNSLTDLGFKQRIPMPMHKDHQSAIYIAKNLVFHYHTKHIEFDCYLVKNMICTTFTLSLE